MRFPSFPQYILISLLFLLGCFGDDPTQASTEVENEMVLGYLNDNVQEFPLLGAVGSNSIGSSSAYKGVYVNSDIQTSHRIIPFDDYLIPDTVDCINERGIYQDTLVNQLQLGIYDVLIYSIARDESGNILDVCSILDAYQTEQLNWFTNTGWDVNIFFYKSDWEYLPEPRTDVYQEYQFNEELILQSDTLSYPFGTEEYDIHLFFFDYQDVTYEVDLDSDSPEFKHNTSYLWASIKEKDSAELKGWMSIDFRYDTQFWSVDGVLIE